MFSCVFGQLDLLKPRFSLVPLGNIQIIIEINKKTPKRLPPNKQTKTKTNQKKPQQTKPPKQNQTAERVVARIVAVQTSVLN